ncbi:MAG TPA: hypothetical protein ENN31_02355 [Candidatus Vogelbacteria bacterium]|nr:hypothetical protein [Candidatus Vogelbacteria bacterium]
MDKIKSLTNKFMTTEKKISDVFYYSYTSLKPFYKLIILMILILASLFLIIYAWQLNKENMVLVASRGGRLNEGVIGSPSVINPLLAVSEADRDLVSLIYSGLLKFDNQGNLTTDLAKSYQISEDGLEYSFTLKNNLTWHDGEKLTADDIVFTINKIKNPALKSPKRINWEGIEIEKIDDKNIKFILIKPYAPFIYNLTLGILPEHLWKDIHAENLALNPLNLSPIGSGPFKIKNIKRNKSGVAEFYDLEPFENYALGEPKIALLRLRFFPNEDELIFAHNRKEIDSWHDFSLANNTTFNINSQKKEYSGSLPRIFGVFLNQNQAEIFIYPEIRQALNLATCRDIITNQILEDGKKVTPIDGLFPPGILNEDEELKNSWEKGLEEAQKILVENSWSKNDETNVVSKSITDKDGRKKEISFSFTLMTSDSPELKKTAEILKGCWEKVGAEVEIKIYESGRLNQDFIPGRKFDALLFGLMVGKEPDPFAYWHSSQRLDPGLNISSYANIKVDNLLEEARETIDKDERFNIYEEINQIITTENPAIFLYSPKFSYFLPTNVKGVEFPRLFSPAERFSGIHDWYIKTDKLWKIFAEPENIIKE